jgi:hypothetical protein
MTSPQCGPWKRALLPAVLIMLAVGSCECNDSNDPVETSILVDVIMTGSMRDDAYTVALSTGETHMLGPGGQSTVFFISPGSYTVTLSDLADNCRVTDGAGSSRHVSVSLGGTGSVTFTVFCPVLATLDVTITGLPASTLADVTVAGGDLIPISRILTQSAQLTDLWPATYSITALPVSSASINFEPDPGSQMVDLADGDAGSAIVNYTGVGTALLTIEIRGLPSGVAADVTVTGPAGSEFTVTSTTTLSNLPAGSYVVSARPVVAGTETYDPRPPDQGVTLFNGQLSGAIVTYERPVVTFEDPFGTGLQWSVAVLAVTGNTTQEYKPDARGGFDDGPYRDMVHTHMGPGSITTRHLFAGGSYSPQTQGAIDRIEFLAWRILRQGPPVGSFVVLVQDGITFTHDLGIVVGPNWGYRVLLNIRQDDFVDFAGSAAKPDFSVAGGEIRFGYIRSSVSTQSGVSVVEHGIDDWKVVVHRASIQ